MEVLLAAVLVELHLPAPTHECQLPTFILMCLAILAVLGALDEHIGWFQLVWPGSWGGTAMIAKEMVPVVVATAI